VIETDDYIVCANPRRFFWQKKQMKWLVVGYYNADSEREGAKVAAERRAEYVAKHLTQLPVETKVHQRPVWKTEDEDMPFKYDVIFSDKLALGLRLEVWYCHVDTPEPYVFNIELVDNDGDKLGLSAGDGEWYESKAACEAAGRVYFLVNYANTPDI
jgi:hypothetical protein